MGSPSFNAMRIIIAIAFLLALSECRRHLCDDGTRPICPDRTSAVYNRPTGKNSRKSNYFPPPVCSGEFPPFCLDGSTPRVRFNTCPAEEKKCPKGQGQGPHDRPFHACADGSQCKCPGGGESCQFHYRRCANKKKCHKRCKSGVPHCPWFTKNRNPHNGIRKHNTGPNRPGNKEGGHHWGANYTGNVPFPHGFGSGHHCERLYKNYGGCRFLYVLGKRSKISRECCKRYRKFRNARCKCDCCYDDSTCVHHGPACNVPTGSTPTCTSDTITWTGPVCPWQGDQTP